MRKYINGKISLAITLLFASVLSMFFITSCQDDEVESSSVKHNLSLEIAHTRAGTVVADLIPNMKLFTFDEGGAKDKKYREEILNITRTTTNLTAKVPVGNWYMAMIAPPAGASIIKPSSTGAMAASPMYKYVPVYNSVAGKSNDADELFFQNTSISPIQANVPKTVNAQLNRTVAQVELVLHKATANFNLSSITHQIKLHNVPSTISYTGGLLPNKTTPDTLSTPLLARLKLSTHPSAVGYLQAETIKFIIPAHQGSDFLSNAPNDTITHFMNLSVDLERTGGSRFKKTVRIPRVARCNHILRVTIEVNDGIEVDTKVLPWELVELQKTVGGNYNGWIYVKSGSTGGGMDWTDALPTINTAITTAAALKAASIPVKGILVAGGASRVYTESLVLPADVKIFGGWAGTPGTELPLEDTAPYTSTHRNLKTNKVRLSVGSGQVSLANANSVLDGFVISGTGTVSAPLVAVSNASAWINAVEIKDNTVVASSVLTLSNGNASNILVSGNNKNIAVFSNGKLVNATIANNNTAASLSSATVYNSIFWPETLALSGTNNIQYSAFVGEIATIPSGTGNIHINATNTAWFSKVITAPGSHFKMTNDSDKYKALNNRAPMLGRGDEALYTTLLGQLHNKDIDGNTRYYTDPQNLAKKQMDIGCYEELEDGLTGFRLTWASDRLYITAKGGYSSNIPLMLPTNNDPNTQIAVTWNARILSSSTWSEYKGTTVNESDHMVVGTLKFQNPGFTPANDYAGTAERQWGQIEVTTNLGGYLPDTKIDVYQVPGANVPWQAGYVGSFHKNNEVGARYIHAYNTGNWEVRILSGLEWIKIDQLGREEGDDITDSAEGKTPHNTYYKKVKEVWGGALKGSGHIKFRVGMKSKNPNAAPRYGLIVITRAGGSAMFFVRQGEADDYLYRSGNPRIINNVELGRTKLVKFSPYNLTDPQGRTSATLTRATSGATKYPSQLGHYFKWNQQTGYVYNFGSSTAASATGASSWSSTREICPTGYRHPSYHEYIQTIYDKAADTKDSVSPTSNDSKNNFAWGAYADGYYDQLAIDDLTVSNSNYNKFFATGAATAAKGILMVNHYDYSSLFFPAGGILETSGIMSTSTVYRVVEYVMVWTGGVDPYGTGAKRNTHWSWRNGSNLTTPHIGMSCTTPEPPEGLNIRCVKE